MVLLRPKPQKAPTSLDSPNLQLRTDPRRAVRRQSINEVLTNWRSFELPDLPDLPHIKALMEVRNGIMHSGLEERANAQFFSVASNAVTNLLAAL
jgi:hypothetical protein